MDKPTIYFLKDIKKTYEIYNAINKIYDDVLVALYNAVENNYTRWLGQGWQLIDVTLSETYDILFINDELNIMSKGEIYPPICPYIELYGDDPIWSLLGIKGSDAGGSSTIGISLDTSILSEYLSANDFIKVFDEMYGEILTNNGFNKRGGSVNRYYEKEISINPEYIIKGLTSEDWDDALLSIKSACEVFKQIKWDFLKTPLSKYKKDLEASENTK